MVDAGAKKNSSDSQKSFEYDVNYIVKPGSDLSVPIFHRDGVGTLLSVRECDPRTSAGCQGFFGPFPSAFLDKRCSKNCGKDIVAGCIFPNPAVFFLFWRYLLIAADGASSVNFSIIFK